MKKLIFLITMIILCSCQETATNEAKQDENIQQIEETVEVEAPKEIPFIPVDPNRESLDFLRDLEGKYPFDSKLFTTEPMKSRLEKLMAHKYMDFIQRMEVQVPIRIEGDLAIMQGLMTHGGGTEEAMLIVDLPKNLMWVGILENGEKVTHLNEDGNIQMPIPLFRMIMDWKS